MRYVTGAGNPPEGGGVVTAIGNVGPLIMQGLPYGDENIRQPPVHCPPIGNMNESQRSALLQRSSKMFTSLAKRPLGTGKTIIAYHASEQALLVGVQKDGEAHGYALAAIRDALIVSGFSDAVFLDGSDSSLLYWQGAQIISPAYRKNRMNTLALGFRRRHAHGH